MDFFFFSLSFNIMFTEQSSFNCFIKAPFAPMSLPESIESLIQDRPLRQGRQSNQDSALNRVDGAGGIEDVMLTVRITLANLDEQE